MRAANGRYQSATPELKVSVMNRFVKLCVLVSFVAFLSNSVSAEDPKEDSTAQVDKAKDKKAQNKEKQAKKKADAKKKKKPEATDAEKQKRQRERQKKQFTQRDKDGDEKLSFQEFDGSRIVY